MTPTPEPVLGWLAARFGYVPQRTELFVTALTHRSASSHNNERLEFLGDAVLNLLVAEHLYAQYPEVDEGALSRLRARIVSAEPLAQIAQGLELGEVVQLGGGELKSGGFRRASILADALEAIIGAVFLDRGLDAARGLVLPLVVPLMQRLPDPSTLKDPKTRLQEWLQARGEALPAYRVLTVTGEPHEQHFEVECRIDEPRLASLGSGSSRRRAEQQAAAELLRRLDGGGEAGRS
jgi:ribonuclease III